MQVRSNDLKDMVVLVVGCGTPGSIGSAIAQAFADAGAALVLADLATSKLVAAGQVTDAWAYGKPACSCQLFANIGVVVLMRSLVWC